MKKTIVMVMVVIMLFVGAVEAFAIEKGIKVEISDGDMDYYSTYVDNEDAAGYAVAELYYMYKGLSDNVYGFYGLKDGITDATYYVDDVEIVVTIYSDVMDDIRYWMDAYQIIMDMDAFEF